MSAARAFKVADPLGAWLAAREGRCAHGRHLATQGCADCGLAGKAQGQSQATAARPSDAARVEAAIRRLAATGKPFSANDARVIHGVKGGVVGATFTALRKEGVIRAVGDETSTDRGTHGHRIYRWVGAA
jgi:hypothetical protein